MTECDGCKTGTFNTKSNYRAKSLQIQSSFPVKQNVGNVGIYALLKFENNLDVAISHINFIPKQHAK